MIMIRTAIRAQSSAIRAAGGVMTRGGGGSLEGFASFDGLAALRPFPPPTRPISPATVAGSGCCAAGES